MCIVLETNHDGISEGHIDAGMPVVGGWLLFDNTCAISIIRMEAKLLYPFALTAFSPSGYHAQLSTRISMRLLSPCDGSFL